MRPSGEIGLHEKRVELFTKRVADLRLSESWNVICAAFSRRSDGRSQDEKE